MAGKLLLQTGRVGARTLAFLHPGPQLGHQGVDVRLLVVSRHDAGW
jgi:hypothetical protein